MRIVTAAKSWIANKAASLLERIDPGREVVPIIGDVPDALWSDLKPEDVKAILIRAEQGTPADQDELFNAMLEKDEHLSRMVDSRHLAIRLLPWEIMPATEEGQATDVDEALAEDAADYCREIIGRANGFAESLDHLGHAHGRGTSLVECVYNRDGSIAEFVDVPFSRLLTDSREPWRLRVYVGGDWNGIAVDEFPEGKWLTFTPQKIGGHFFRGGLLRRSVVGAMGKRVGRKAWMYGVEKHGLPYAIAKYAAGTSPEERKLIIRMMRDLSINRGGVFTQGTEIELIEPKNTIGVPHDGLLTWIDYAFSKLWLGQTMTTEVGKTGGAFAAAKVHDDVREDIRDDDCAKEAACIRRQLLRPLVLRKFGERGLDVIPIFRRVIEEPRDLKVMAELAASAVNDLGAPVKMSFVQNELGLPLVDGTNLDAPLPGRSTGFDAFALPAAENVANRSHRNCPSCGSTGVANRTLETILARRRSSAAKTAAWIFAAVSAFGAYTGKVVTAAQDFIDRKRTLEAALADLPELFDALPREDAVELETEFLVAARLAGMDVARDKVRRSGKRAGHPRLATREAVRNDAIDFERIPFVKAIESLRDRIGVSPEEFEELEAEARSRAWRVAGVHDMSVLATIHQALVKSIAEGETSRSFRNRLPQMVDAAGWSGENPWHADLVHFQNFMMAHAAGRFAEYQEFGAAGWRFVSNGDACPICEPLINKVFRLSDRRYFPPIHFWCDCEDEVVFDGEVENFDAESDVSNPALDEEQERKSAFKWDVAAYANLEPVKLDGFPEGMRPTYRRFAESRGWEIAA